MAMLDKGASGRLHLAWVGRIHAIARAHLEINHELDAAQRAALEQELTQLGARVTPLAASVGAYRTFLETAFTEVRAKERVADFLIDQAQRRAAAQVKPVKADVDAALPGGAAGIFSNKPLSRILDAGRQATVRFARTAASKLRSLPDKALFAFAATAASALEGGADLLETWHRKEIEDVEAQRLPLRSAVERDVAALREQLVQMNGRLRTHFAQAFIDSLYPELARNNTRLAEPDDEDDTAPVSDTPVVAPPET